MVLIAEEADKPVGFALYFYNFFTFWGDEDLYLGDLFVLPEQCGKGYGKALFRSLARVAKLQGWWWLDW